MKALLALALLAVLGIAAVFLWLGGAHLEPEPVSAATRAAQERSPAGSREPRSVESPETVEAPVQPLAADAPIDHRPVEIAPVDFEAKYKDWSLERLAGAEAVLDDSVKAMLEKIYAERKAAGKFGEYVAAPGESFTSPAFTGPNTTWSESLGDGRMRFRWIEIHDGDSPALDALRNEHSWVSSRVRALQREKKR